jgi:hypothetical protein
MHDLALHVAELVASGYARATVTVAANWRAPKGFPRYELLSVNATGERNLSVPSGKLLAWLNTQ